MATKRISQLETIADASVTGEAILPIVISDPLVPNRKAKINQLFRGVSKGSATAPGIAFDLDRTTGLFQDQNESIGVTFGTSTMYFSTTSSGTNATIVQQIQDTAYANVSLQMRPTGSGFFSVNGQSRFTDAQTYIVDSQNPDKRAYFGVNTISAQAGNRRFDLPNVGTNTSTVLVGNDTFQSLINKTITIKDLDFKVTGSTSTSKVARFECDHWDAAGEKIYKFPDLRALYSETTLVDTQTEQNLFNKNMVNPTFSNTPSTDENNPTRYVIFDSSLLTQDRTVTFPDLNVKVVGEAASQTITNKSYKGAVFEDVADASKKINFNLNNLEQNSNYAFGFPNNDPAAPLNTTGTSILVSELKTQTLKNKTLETTQLKNPDDPDGIITLDLSNITSGVTIQFPDADATLLSTNNIAAVGVNFGGPLSAPTLGGRLRLQSFFQASW